MGGVYLSKPITEGQTEYGENAHLAYVTSSAQGWRSSMEDAHINILNFNGDPDSALFAVFDGHGGSEVAVYCAREYPRILSHALQSHDGALTDATIQSILIQSFITLDDSLLSTTTNNTNKNSNNNNNNNNNNNYNNDNNGDDDDDDDSSETPDSTYVGCTAVVALLHRGKLYVANSGDSRCIACERCGVARALSRDHKPLNPGERRRIRAAGHSVSEEGRIDGNINISRTIGDHRYKDAALPHAQRAISCVPEVQVVPVGEGGDGDGDGGGGADYVVLACDGVWDVMANQSLANFVTKRMFPRRAIPRAAAERLCDEGVFPAERAYEKGALLAWPGDVAETTEELLRATAQQVVQRCIAERPAGLGCDNVSFLLVLFRRSALGRLVEQAVGIGAEGEGEEEEEDLEKIRDTLEEKWNGVADEVERVNEEMNNKKGVKEEEDDDDDDNNDDSDDDDNDDNNDDKIEGAKPSMKRIHDKKSDSRMEGKLMKKKKKRKLVFKEEKISK